MQIESHCGGLVKHLTCHFDPRRHKVPPQRIEVGLDAESRRLQRDDLAIAQRQLIVVKLPGHGRRLHGILADHVALDPRDFAVEPPPIDVLDLDAALRTLATFDERKSRILEMHFFGGLTFVEIATVLDVHVNTVARDLRLARAWLLARLRPDSPGDHG